MLRKPPRQGGKKELEGEIGAASGRYPVLTTQDTSREGANGQVGKRPAGVEEHLGYPVGDLALPYGPRSKLSNPSGVSHLRPA